MLGTFIFIMAMQAPPIRMAPDGSFVSGTPRLAPDGTFVGGTPRLAPNGTFA